MYSRLSKHLSYIIIAFGLDKKLDFGKIEYHQKGVLKRSRMAQNSAPYFQ